MRAARAAAEAMRERLPTPVLCQGDDSTSALVERFSAEPQTSLFGTLSLWQGVDVPGPSLSLVLIDRIPFPRPDDPLLGARQRAVAARGGNGFMAVAASHAALLLAQGSGRLLRRVTDRGVVAVLDSRMVTAGYGGYLRASLPPFWQTDRPAAGPRGAGAAAHRAGRRVGLTRGTAIRRGSPGRARCLGQHRDGGAAPARCIRPPPPPATASSSRTPPCRRSAVPVYGMSTVIGSCNASLESTRPTTAWTATSSGRSPPSCTVAVRVSFEPSSGVSGSPVLSTSVTPIFGHACSTRRR